MPARAVRSPLAAAALVALAGCGSSTGPGRGDPPPLLTELPRALTREQRQHYEALQKLERG